MSISIADFDREHACFQSQLTCSLGQQSGLSYTEFFYKGLVGDPWDFC